MTPRFSWPWGRISPDRRLDEIDRMIRRQQATINIIQTQAREAQRLHEMSIQALRDQKVIVEAFLNEDHRRRTMERAYALESEGYPVLEKIAAANTVIEIEQILAQYDGEKTESGLIVPPQEPKMFAGPTPTPDIFSEGLGDTDEMFGHHQGEEE